MEIIGTFLFLGFIALVIKWCDIFIDFILDSDSEDEKLTQFVDEERI